jgi:hypothetical protein
MELSNEKPTNGELEIMIKNTDKNLQEFRAETKESIKELGTQISDFIKCADNKYASKTTEKIVYSMIGAICLAVLGGLLSLIIK